MKEVRMDNYVYTYIYSVELELDSIANCIRYQDSCTIVSGEAKKKHAVRDERMSYLQAAPL